MHFKSLLIVFALAVGLASAQVYAEGAAPVNINKATAQELADGLVGIGLARAQAIIEYRKEFGPFEDAYELVNVRGVGERTVSLNEAKITLK